MLASCLSNSKTLLVLRRGLADNIVRLCGHGQLCGGRRTPTDRGFCGSLQRAKARGKGEGEGPEEEEGGLPRLCPGRKALESAEPASETAMRNGKRLAAHHVITTERFEKSIMQAVGGLKSRKKVRQVLRHV